jgi:hypothetical protein
MAKLADFKESKFLAQKDVEKPMLVTITGCEKHNVAKEGATPIVKLCMEFEELEKPLVMNWTNAQVCAQAFNSEDTDDWIGKQIVLYVEPNVMFEGRLVGGIRMRKPKPQAAKPVPVPAPVEADDIPFAWLMPFVLPALGLMGGLVG